MSGVRVPPVRQFASLPAVLLSNETKQFATASCPLVQKNILARRERFSQRLKRMVGTESKYGMM